MKIFSRLFFLPLGVFLFSAPVQAKHKHQAQATPAPLATPTSEPAALPSEAAPAVNPGDPPSVSLQRFVDTHLGKILAPLGTSAFAQPEVLASLKASYADGMAGAPDAHKAAYQLAQSVCDAMTGAMTERQNAVAALRGALATRSSEAEQPRGGGQAVTEARDKDAFFIDSQKNTWLQRATVLSQNITALYLRERAVERQIGVWSPPPAPAPAASPAAAKAVPPVAAVTAAAAPPAVAAAATPAVSAPPATIPEADPVVGAWLLGGRSPLTLGMDYTIAGDRHGYWRYTGTTNSGRNYEMHWNLPKDWVDYLVLSGDGKTLDGKSRKGQHIVYLRPGA